MVFDSEETVQSGKKSEGFRVQQNEHFPVGAPNFDANRDSGSETDVEHGATDENAPPEYPGYSLPHRLRAPLAEMLGTFVLVLMGLGSNVNAFVNWSNESNYVAYTFGWGVGLFLALLISIPYAGGHVNPAITISQAFFRGFAWRMVPIYIASQTLGAFLAAVALNGVFYNLLDSVEGEPGLRTFGEVNSTAQFFIAVPSGHLSNVSTVFYEIIGGAMLLLGVAVVSDDEVAGDWSMWVKSLVMYLTLVGVNGAIGVKTPLALNPARDFGPRVACSAFGYPAHMWTDRNGYWFYGAWAGPILGGLIVTAIYDLAVRKRVQVTIPFLDRRRRHRRRRTERND